MQQDDELDHRHALNDGIDPYDREINMPRRPPMMPDRVVDSPAAIQRIPNWRDVPLDHGPTVDQSVVHVLTFREIEYMYEFDVAVLVYGVMAVVITYMAYAYRDHIINSAIYDKFHDHKVKYAESPGLVLIRVVPEAVKLFSLFAYDVMIIMYLVRPLKNSSHEERDLTKKYQDMMKALGSTNRGNAQNSIRVIEELQSRRSDMLASRYKLYNDTMLHALKSGLTLDFLIACLGMIAFLVSVVTLQLT